MEEVCSFGLMESLIQVIMSTEKKQGFGVYKYADGKVYEGQWVNGKQSGEGRII